MPLNRTLALAVAVFIAIASEAGADPIKPTPSAAPAAAAGYIKHVDGTPGSNDVVIVTGSAPAQTAHVKDGLFEGDHIRTSSNGGAGVILNDGSELTIGASSDVVVTTAYSAEKPETLIELAYGLLHTAVNAAYTAEHPFVVQTKNSVMGVRGTEFVAEHDAASGQSTVHTLEGSVAVGSDRASLSSPGASQTVGAGQATSMARGQRAPQAPQAFDRQSYMSSLARRSPTFAQHVQAAHANHQQQQQQIRQRRQQATPRGRNRPASKPKPRRGKGKARPQH